MYRYYNANPMLNNIEDCSIRALSVAENISWDEAYRILSDYARKRGLMLSSVMSIEQFLDDNYNRVCNYDMTVQDFIEENPYGTYLITMPGHITVVKDGINYDTFSTLKRKMWCAWEVI